MKARLLELLSGMKNLDPIVLVLAVSTFGTVAACWSMLILMLSRRRAASRSSIQARLSGDHRHEAISGKEKGRTLRLWHEGKLATTTVRDDAGNRSLGARLEQFRRDAGWEMSTASLSGLFTLGLLGLGAVFYMLSGRLVVGLIGLATGAMVLWWYANRRVSKRRVLFERQLVDALELSARALRAGHPLLSSFQLIAEEVPAPVGRIFAEICQEQGIGVPLETSLRNAARDSKNRDMKLFSATMAINIKTGGNLADVVDGLARVIRERIRLSRRFRVLTAQTQFSKRILIALPITMFAVLNLIDPEYMGLLYDTRPGHLLLFLAAATLLFGWWVMNKMSTIHD